MSAQGDDVGRPALPSVVRCAFGKRPAVVA